MVQKAQEFRVRKGPAAMARYGDGYLLLQFTQHRGWSNETLFPLVALVDQSNNMASIPVQAIS